MTLRFIPDHGLDHATLDADCQLSLEPDNTLHDVLRTVVLNCKTLDKKFIVNEKNLLALLEDPNSGAELAALVNECRNSMSFRPLRLLGMYSTRSRSKVFTHCLSRGPPSTHHSATAR